MPSTAVMSAGFTANRGAAAGRIGGSSPKNLTMIPEARPTKLFIGGISRHTTTNQLQEHFSQYGRVLDCVAMKEPNGRSRGFGYVTFNSPASADRCLREPQKIDGRLVDMKPAVPEGSASSMAQADNQMLDDMSMAAMQHQMPYDMWPESPAGFPESPASYQGAIDLGVAWWAGAAGPDPQMSGMTVDPSSVGGQLDCLALLSGGGTVRQHAMLEAPGLRAPQSARRTPQSAANKLMSANAPEFVPFAPSSAENEVASTAANTKPARTPLGELTDSSANVAAGNLKDIKGKSTPKGLKAVAAAQPQQLGQGQTNALPLPLPAGNVTKLATASKLGLVANFSEEVQKDKPVQQDEATKEDVVVVQEEAGDVAAPEQAASESGESDTAAQETSSDVVSDGNLPSLGSALHASGECRSCNFFTKGRCQNGKECSFCHFTHEKRKPSRAQKRERQLVQHMQGKSGLMIDVDFDEEQVASALGSPMDSSFLGLPPFLASQLPSAAMCGSPSLNAAALGLAMGNTSVAEGPPGLSAPLGLPLTPCMAELHQWQANEEANMALLSALTDASTLQAQCSPSFLSTAPPSHNIFSTAPPSVVAPMATPTYTPTAEAEAETTATATFDWSTSATSKLSAVVSADSSVERSRQSERRADKKARKTGSAASALSADALEPRYIEMSTQTACARCEVFAEDKEAVAETADVTESVTREDMLRIRSGMEKASGAESTAGGRRATWRTAVQRGAFAQ